jgi:mono/diheme cytochrome c family protein
MYILRPVFFAPALLLSAALAAAEAPTPLLRQYCFSCHGKAAMGGLSLEKLTSQPSFGEGFQHWEKVATAIETKRMPPAKLPQPTDAERTRVVSWIRDSLKDYAAKNAGDPGRVTVRRLTSGEYAYAVNDLTGLDFKFDRDFVPDSVGGEGFTNFGDVQFLGDANLERYLSTAKYIANHAVIGAGPLTFFADPGKTGFELSALNRITKIYTTHGFRATGAEGALPYNLDKYNKAFYTAWRYQHRAALGTPTATLESIGAREGLTPRFVNHIWKVVNEPNPTYPTSEAVSKFKALPGPKTPETQVRAACEEIQKTIINWPRVLFAAGALAAGGAGDERNLVISADTLKAVTSYSFRYPYFSRRVIKDATVYLTTVSLNPRSKDKPAVVFTNAKVNFRKTDRSSAGEVSLYDAIDEESRKRLTLTADGKGFTLTGDAVVPLHVVFPPGVGGISFNMEAAMLPQAAGDAIIRLTLSNEADVTKGRPSWTLLADPKSPGYTKWRDDVLSFASVLPQNSQAEANPADRDPIPNDFDNTYGLPERNAFHTQLKYYRFDDFLVKNILDDKTRAELNTAWNDLYASFEFHELYVKFLEDKKAPASRIETLKAENAAVDKAILAAQPGHVEDALQFAAKAWRRPLTPLEKDRLRRFYTQSRETQKLSHPDAIRAVIARVLVSPAFLYRLEQPAQTSKRAPLTSWELANRLSFFLWSSLPDAELRRAAEKNELLDPAQLARQTKRMLADPKAARLSTEFFGQWLGFYRFDQYTGADTSRFPEFTDDLKTAMYEEATSFFDYIVRQNRPVSEIISANYTFANPLLAKHYGVKKELTGGTQKIENANDIHRGGLLRMGAVLTATSAPLRTSPVKRGDWVLRRILGTPTPPPPPNVPPIAKDDKDAAGLTIKARLTEHMKNPTCAACHSKIDPLGFPFERYDAVGRYRQAYADGKPVEDEIGIEGLIQKLKSQEPQLLRNMSHKLLGYALGRTVLASDQPLVDRLIQAGGQATFTQLATEIVTSPQFRYRRGEQPAELAKDIKR